MMTRSGSWRWDTDLSAEPASRRPPRSASCTTTALDAQEAFAVLCRSGTTRASRRESHHLNLARGWYKEALESRGSTGLGRGTIGLLRYRSQGVGQGTVAVS